jgi:hypothetical protein
MAVRVGRDMARQGLAVRVWLGKASCEVAVEVGRV